MNDVILLIDKPAGITSFDAIARVRKLLRVKKIGHSGTLDKAAEGLIVAATGKATRLTRFFLESDKKYTAVIKLGESTDTYDSDGVPVAACDTSFLTEEMITGALLSMKGKQLQIPPRYSALKVNGVRASDRVRNGEQIELSPRAIEIYSIDIESVNLADMTVRAEIFCSKGTYIRSIARDLGEKLSVGAHLAFLRRTVSGKFSVNDAIKPDEIGEAFSSGRTSFIVSMESAVDWMPSVSLSAELSAKVKNGLRMHPEQLGYAGISEFALFDESQKLIAIARRDEKDGLLSYLCVFN